MPVRHIERAGYCHNGRFMTISYLNLLEKTDKACTILPGMKKNYQKGVNTL